MRIVKKTAAWFLAFALCVSMPNIVFASQQEEADKETELPVEEGTSDQNEADSELAIDNIISDEESLQSEEGTENAVSNSDMEENEQQAGDNVSENANVQVNDSKSQNVESDAEVQTADEENKQSEVEKNLIPSVQYRAHVQTYGWRDWVLDGDTAGTTGESKRVESLEIKIVDSEGNEIDGAVRYRTHVQTYGWRDWVSDGDTAGTTGESKRVEAIQMQLTGELAEEYDIYYTAHVQTFGWLKWTKGSADESGICGTEGLQRRIEAIMIQLVKKGEEPPQNNAQKSCLTQDDIGELSYSGHQQRYGDLTAVSGGTILGHIGESLRMEGVRISISDSVIGGGIRYRAHVQGYGWLGWAKNGQIAGTSGISYRIEAIEIRAIPKAGTAPGVNSEYYKDVPKMSAVDLQIYNYCQNVYNSVGRDLRSCYNWVVNNMSYQTLGVPSLPSGYTSRSQWYAIKAFRDHRGNCYCYAAAFYYLAKYLGYNAEYVEGRVTAAGGGYTPHGWVVINGAYICDPEAQDEIGRYNFYMQPLGSPVLSYIR